jgi:hypothetical protein
MKAGLDAAYPGGNCLKKVGIYLQDYMISHPFI